MIVANPVLVALDEAKKYVVLFGRYHSLRRQDACLYELDDNHVPSALDLELDDQQPDVVLQNYPDTISAASNPIESEIGSLGYANNIKGTSGVIHGLGELTSPLHTSRSRHGPDPSQYASVIRELPSRRHIEILVQAFFRNVAWHYDIVDEATFTDQLSQWRCLTHSQLKQAPEGLPPSLRSFPALLFQVLAQALLFQPTQYDESLDDLKYAADMELSDRAADYSDAGHRLASSFRKTELNLTIIQAELMRACFEKTTGAVIEAWHTLGVNIRNAQELGLHQTLPEPTAYPSTETPTDCELGRKLWLILHLWDAHMGVVLGRPMLTRMRPDDVPLPTSWGCSSGTPNPPNARDVILCGYHTAYKLLQDIHDLEKVEDSHLLVENIHEIILTNIANLPAWATARRSRDGEPPWLSAALEMMLTNVNFVLFALHRPFIFAEPSSRGRAFHAAIQILESQARLFDQTEPLQYKAFSLVFATFDAMVVIAAIHIRFPGEFTDHYPASRRNLEWGLDRLSQLQASNVLAVSAFKVGRRLYQRMLDVNSPVDPARSLYEGVEIGSFMGVDSVMLQVDWDSFLQHDLGSVLPPLAVE